MLNFNLIYILLVLDKYSKIFIRRICILLSVRFILKFISEFSFLDFYDQLNLFFIILIFVYFSFKFLYNKFKDKIYFFYIQFVFFRFDNLLKFIFILLGVLFYLFINIYFFENNAIMCENSESKFRKTIVIGTGIVIVGVGIITYVQIKHMLDGLQHREKIRLLSELDKQNSQILIDYRALFSNRNQKFDMYVNDLVYQSKNKVANWIDIDKPLVSKKVLDLTIIKNDFIPLFNTPVLIYGQNFNKNFAEIIIKQKELLRKMSEFNEVYTLLSKKTVFSIEEQNLLILLKINCNHINKLLDDYVKITLNVGDEALSTMLAGLFSTGFQSNPNKFLYKKYYISKNLTFSDDFISLNIKKEIKNIENSIFVDFTPNLLFVRDFSVISFYCIGYILSMFTSFVNPIPSDYAVHSWNRLFYNDKTSISFLKYYEKPEFYKFKDWYEKK